MRQEHELTCGQICSLAEFLSENNPLVNHYELQEEYKIIHHYHNCVRKFKIPVKGVWRFSIGKAARKIVDELLWHLTCEDAGLKEEQRYEHLDKYFRTRSGMIHSVRVEKTEPGFWNAIQNPSFEESIEMAKKLSNPALYEV